MSEQDIPKIEDEILTHLNSELQEAALGFAAHLNANSLTPQRWFGSGYWHIPYEGNYLFGIHLYGFNPQVHNNGWVFWFFSGDYNREADKKLIQFVHDNVGYCVKCSDDCGKGVDMTIFGKASSNMYCQFPIRIENPDSESLEKIKDLMEYWKGVAPHSDSFHAH